MSKWFRVHWPCLTLVMPVVLAAKIAAAQTSIDVEVQGYLCSEPRHAQAFQHAAAANPRMPRSAMLWRFNRSRETPRCEWYERTHMIFKGPLRKGEDSGDGRVRHLFAGGAGGVFEVLVYETPDGSETLYSWRRTQGEAG